MKVLSTIYGVRKLFGNIKPINDRSLPVIVWCRKSELCGYWLEFWSIEDIVKGTKEDQQGFIKTFIEYY